jgi:hypothetical protein
MKFILELMKYDLLKPTDNEARYVITPKGMQYLQIHDELTGQMRSDTARNLRIFDYCNNLFKLTSLFKKKNNLLDNI